MSHASGSRSLGEIGTPALLLDTARMDANIDRLRTRLAARGVRLRPHLKTAKNIEIARRMMASSQGPCAVSTLAEAEYFAGHGVRGLIYAVGFEPGKTERLLALRSTGVDVAVLVDSLAQAEAVDAASRGFGEPVSAYIEVDVDGHRGGVRPDSDMLVTIAAHLQSGQASFAGLLAHAGESYRARSAGELAGAAANERHQVLLAAGRLRAAGIPVRDISIGSTPTAFFAEDLSGISEVRAGVYVFFDLVMAGLGVCSIDDIAISVLATVIGHNADRGWIITDAGWMAMSSDRGTAQQSVDQYYGLVCDAAGRPYGDLVLVEANQEHGILAMRPGSASALPSLSVGDRVRILPNHACATAAQFDRYQILGDGGQGVIGQWERARGW